MTNFEKYKEKILEIAECGDDVAFDIDRREVVGCNDLISCGNCLFEGGGCTSKFVRWLYEEAKERRFSKEDIELAKLLKEMGAEYIEMSGTRERAQWGDMKGHAGWLPPKAFRQLESLESISIDTIIKEETYE